MIESAFGADDDGFEVASKLLLAGNAPFDVTQDTHHGNKAFGRYFLSGK